MSKLYVNEIASKTGGTDALTIDSNGRVSMPARPIFYAVSEENFTHANGTYSTLATWAADINRGNIFSTTTGKFTAPVAGIYQVSTGLTYTGLADSAGDGWGIKIFKNGSDFTNVELAYVAGIQNGVEGHSNATIYMDLAVNDYVEVGGDGTTVNLNIQHLYFGAHLVG